MKTTVLHVIDSLRTGGTERQLIQVLRHADRSMFRHLVCLIRDPEATPGQALDSGVAVHSLGLEKKSDLLLGVQRLRALIRELQPDIIHTRLYLSTIIGRIAGRLTGRPVLTTLVNRAYSPDWRAADPALRDWKVAVVRTLDAATASWTLRYVAISDSVRRSAMEHLGIPAERISVIHRGIDANDFPNLSAEAISQIRRSLGWPDVNPLIVNVGRLVPQKGQQYLIEAMRDVVKALPRARLAIAGDGRLRESLTRQIRSQGLEGSVQLLGERDDVPALLKAADLFVFPSISEGFGVALLEAMAAGVPCIASDIEAAREIGGTNGVLLVQPRSAGALAQAIVAVASDPDRRNSMVASSQRHAAQFDLQNQVRKLEALYQSVLDLKIPAAVERTDQDAAHVGAARREDWK